MQRTIKVPECRFDMLSTADLERSACELLAPRGEPERAREGESKSREGQKKAGPGPGQRIVMNRKPTQDRSNRTDCVCSCCALVERGGVR